MDRIEAYKLLTEQMDSLARLTHHRDDGTVDAATEADVLGAGGIRYHVEMVLDWMSDERFAITGKIHDNNSHQFSLLEERREFDAPTNAPVA